jgi:hypothetical protein
MHHGRLTVLILRRRGTLMKRLVLAVAVLCGLAGATVALAGLSAVPAAACTYHTS